MKNCKTHILLLLLLMQPLIIQGKNSYLPGTYEIRNISANCACYLDLYEDRQYTLLLDDHFNDMVKSVVLSYGSYFIKNGRIILTDACLNFTMSFQIITKDKLKADKVFSFLKSKVFISNIVGYQDPNLLYHLNKDKVNIATERNKHKEQNKSLIKVGGIYSNNADVELALSNGMTYTYKINGFVVSSGTWDRYDNELVLKDTNLKQSFYVLIEKAGLNCKLLPGFYNELLTFSAPRWS